MRFSINGQVVDATIHAQTDVFHIASGKAMPEISKEGGKMAVIKLKCLYQLMKKGQKAFGLCEALTGRIDLCSGDQGCNMPVLSRWKSYPRGYTLTGEGAELPVDLLAEPVNIIAHQRRIS